MNKKKIRSTMVKTVIFKLAGTLRKLYYLSQNKESIKLFKKI